jgi:hypothetical protein
LAATIEPFQTGPNGPDRSAMTPILTTSLLSCAAAGDACHQQGAIKGNLFAFMLYLSP